MHRIAVIADIHGNSWALREVVRDLLSQRCERVVSLGDVAYGPLDPRGTADLLLGLPVPLEAVAGNQDRMVTGPDQEPISPTLAYTRAALDPCHLAWLRDMPFTLRVDGRIALFHGTPVSDEGSLLEDLGPDGVRPRDGASIRAALDGVDAGLVLCGHTHLARLVHLEGGPLVVNPGSVGLPAYADTRPVPHRVETGCTHARYAIVSSRPSGWRVEHVAVPYDHEEAARAAERNGRPDWAYALRTGRAAA